MTPLAPGFLTRPIAHRGLHDRRAGRPENGLGAVAAAAEAGYAIEIDVQPSRDGVAMVFHDAALARMTGQAGAVRDHDASALAGLPLLDSTDTVPTLVRLLETVAGRVPLLVEIKDQPGDPRTACASLTDATLAALAHYEGPVACMSFNPFAVAHGAARRPDLAWGVTTGHGTPLWPDHPALEDRHLHGAVDPRSWGGSFISHGLNAADAPWLAALAASGVDILAWTVTTPEEEARARRYAANITFEGYLPALRGDAA